PDGRSTGPLPGQQQLFRQTGYQISCRCLISAAVEKTAHRPAHLRRNSMLKEYHYDHLIRWPKGERACVFLTFDFQGGEYVKPDKNGFLNYEMWSQGEYGPHHAIYRLLRILREENVKATFLTCGAIAERFPEAVQAILDHGHVVEGHGYNHEVARYLPRDQE